MSDNKRSTGQNFLKGALVLTVANLVVKIIGAGFKIPLIGLIGDDGMGLFNVAYQSLCSLPGDGATLSCVCGKDRQ